MPRILSCYVGGSFKFITILHRGAWGRVYWGPDFLYYLICEWPLTERHLLIGAATIRLQFGNRILIIVVKIISQSTVSILGAFSIKRLYPNNSAQDYVQYLWHFSHYFQLAKFLHSPKRMLKSVPASSKTVLKLSALLMLWDLQKVWGLPVLGYTTFFFQFLAAGGRGVLFV